MLIILNQFTLNNQTIHKKLIEMKINYKKLIHENDNFY